MIRDDMDNYMQVGKWTVKTDSGELEWKSKTVRLKPRLMDLLLLLAEQPGRVFTKRQLLDVLWKDVFVTEGVLMNAVSELRRLLGDDTRNPTYIDTLHRRGYRLIAPVTNGKKHHSPSPQAPADTAAPRLAILPFEYFQSPESDPQPSDAADALTDLILTSLAISQRAWTVSRFSASTVTTCIAEQNLTLHVVMKRFHIEWILEGMLFRSRTRAEVSARLYNAKEEILWADLFEEDVKDDFLSNLRKLADCVAQNVTVVL